MKLTALQTDLLQCLQSAIEAKPSHRVVYCSEWLGYLPFGVYHWVDADGQDISLSFPWGWSRSDLESLERAGFITKIDEWKSPDDEYDFKVTFEVALAKPDARVGRPRE